MCKNRWLGLVIPLLLSDLAFAEEHWPELDFPPEAKVELIAEESWVAGFLPVRIFEVTAISREKDIFSWLAADWLRNGRHCLLNSEPLEALEDVPPGLKHKPKVLSCLLDEYVVVGEFSAGLRGAALISLSAPARAKKRPTSSTVLALQSYVGGRILSQEHNDFGPRQATTVALEAKGQPDFVVGSLAGALIKNNWRVERLRGLPGSGHMGRELVAVREDERLLVSVQALGTAYSGVVAVIEKGGE
ncbi:hypothetical protein GCM10022278_28280 [Allohahella marinimesophila]|uniref:Flagella basal body P-ring formation protein FlgA n=2 Tax=Allohahella marinimesophila TaxID=1054972 RepID=A0ABP7PP19_9GAMM